MWSWILMVLLLLTAVFLIVLVLIQRGKGGGLAGAFGGLGGQSAFGTKAGDLFTRVTVGVATFWILLCVVTVWVLGGSKAEDQFDADLGGGPRQESGLGADQPAGDATGGGSEPTPKTPAKTPANPKGGS
jgi:preprotein translocase subunit SecG